MPALSAAEVASHLTRVPDWKVENGELVRTFQFEDFRASMRFVNEVAGLAKRLPTIPTSTSATTASAWLL